MTPTNDAPVTVEQCDRERIKVVSLRLLNRMREVARQDGWALAVHGSMSRDLDLIAVPWTDIASDETAFVEALRAAVACALGGVALIGAGEDGRTPGGKMKPNGRRCYTLHSTSEQLVEGAAGAHPYVDLSVMDFRLAALASAPAAKAEWRCFHCGDVFTDERCARLHFGRDEDSEPACVIKAGAEQGLLGALREAEYAAADARQAIADESTDAAKSYYAQATRHATALRNAEEAGYERGLADGRSLASAPAGDGAEDRFWLIVREPGMVPDRKGPFRHTDTAKILREFMAANPRAFIDHLTVATDGTPWVDHGPEVLQMTDGRSMSVGRKHNARVREVAEAALARPRAAVGEREAWELPDLRDLHRDVERVRDHDLGNDRMRDLLRGAMDMLKAADVEYAALQSPPAKVEG